MPAYVAGKPPEVREGMRTYKLSSNENPFPPLPEIEGVTGRIVSSVVARAIETVGEPVDASSPVDTASTSTAADTDAAADIVDE